MLLFALSRQHFHGDSPLRNEIYEPSLFFKIITVLSLLLTLETLDLPLSVSKHFPKVNQLYHSLVPAITWLAIVFFYANSHIASWFKEITARNNYKVTPSGTINRKSSSLDTKGTTGDYSKPKEQ
jgi:hypothetical protein